MRCPLLLYLDCCFPVYGIISLNNSIPALQVNGMSHTIDRVLIVRFVSHLFKTSLQLSLRLFKVWPLLSNMIILTSINMLSRGCFTGRWPYGCMLCIPCYRPQQLNMNLRQMKNVGLICKIVLILQRLGFVQVACR